MMHSAKASFETRKELLAAFGAAGDSIVEFRPRSQALHRVNFFARSRAAGCGRASSNPATWAEFSNPARYDGRPHDDEMGRF